MSSFGASTEESRGITYICGHKVPPPCSIGLINYVTTSILPCMQESNLMYWSRFEWPNKSFDLYIKNQSVFLSSSHHPFLPQQCPITNRLSVLSFTCQCFFSQSKGKGNGSYLYMVIVIFRYNYWV